MPETSNNFATFLGAFPLQGGLGAESRRWQGRRFVIWAGMVSVSFKEEQPHFSQSTSSFLVSESHPNLQHGKI